MNSTKTSFLAALLLLSAVACKQPSAQHSEEGAATEATHNAAPANTPPPAAELSAADQAAADKALIEKYIAEKGLKAQSTPNGIYYVMEQEGSGGNPTAQSVVKVHYEGTLLNGSKFDSSYDRNQPIEFPLQQVIPGWQQGIPLFKKGGKGLLIIPSGLAYGKQSPPPIPPNSVLVFKVELLDFK